MSRTNKFLFSLTTAALVGSLAQMAISDVAVLYIIGLVMYLLMLFLYKRFSGMRFFMPIFTVVMAIFMILSYVLTMYEFRVYYYIRCLPAYIGGGLMICCAFLPFVKNVGSEADESKIFGLDNVYLLFMLALATGGVILFPSYFFIYAAYIPLTFVLSAAAAYMIGQRKGMDIAKHIIVGLGSAGIVVINFIFGFGLGYSELIDILFAIFTLILATLYYISKFTKVFEPRVKRLGARRQTAARYGEGSRPHSRYTHSARDAYAYREEDGYGRYDKTEAYMPGEDIYAEENTIDPGTDNEKEE